MLAGNWDDWYQGPQLKHKRSKCSCLDGRHAVGIDACSSCSLQLLLDIASCPVLQHMLLLDKEKLHIQRPNLEKERQQDTTLCLANNHTSADSVSYIRVYIFIAIARH